MKFVGVDYHKSFSYATMLDTETGEVTQRKLENREEELRDFIGDGEHTRAVMESSRCWGWMYDMLDRICDEVKLAHPYKVRAIAEARIKNDKMDSRILAQLLSADLIPEAYARKEDNRSDLFAIRQRTFFVKLKSMIKNRIHYVVDRHGNNIEPPRPKCSDLFGKAGMNWLKNARLPREDRKLLDELVESLEFTRRKVAQSDSRIRKMFKNDPTAQLLATIPGIGTFFSVLISKEIDDINRFPTPEKLHSYAGLVPSTYASGGNIRHGSLTKTGNRWLRWALVEAAIPAVNSNYQLRKLYERHKYRKGSAKNAKIVVARRLLTIVFRMWKENRPFEEYKTSKPEGAKRAAFIVP